MLAVRAIAPQNVPCPDRTEKSEKPEDADEIADESEIQPRYDLSSQPAGDKTDEQYDDKTPI